MRSEFFEHFQKMKNGRFRENYFDSFSESNTRSPNFRSNERLVLIGVFFFFIIFLVVLGLVMWLTNEDAIYRKSEVFFLDFRAIPVSENSEIITAVNGNIYPAPSRVAEFLSEQGWWIATPSQFEQAFQAGADVNAFGVLQYSDRYQVFEVWGTLVGTTNSGIAAENSTTMCTEPNQRLNWEPQAWMERLTDYPVPVSAISSNPLTGIWVYGVKPELNSAWANSGFIKNFNESLNIWKMDDVPEEFTSITTASKFYRNVPLSSYFEFPLTVI